MGMRYQDGAPREDEIDVLMFRIVLGVIVGLAVLSGSVLLLAGLVAP